MNKDKREDEKKEKQKSGECVLLQRALYLFSSILGTHKSPLSEGIQHGCGHYIAVYLLQSGSGLC